MTISQLKTIIQEQLEGLPIKAILNTDGSTPKKSDELFVPAPLPGYVGLGVVKDGPSFVWRFTKEGDDWFFSSEVVDS